MKQSRRRPRWVDLSPRQRAVRVVLGIAQVVLAFVAWVDLAKRPAELVRGRKAVWAGVIAINFIGPILYLTKGRTWARPPN